MNIAHLRQEYMRAGLSEAHALADPLAQFQHWFEEAQGAGNSKRVAEQAAAEAFIQRESIHL